MHYCLFISSRKSLAAGIAKATKVPTTIPDMKPKAKFIPLNAKIIIILF